MRSIVHRAIGMSALVLATASHAQTSIPTSAYPARSVRILVGYSAGGPTDVIARLIAHKLSEQLGRNFYVENVTGAGGAVATAQVANSAPDGHTLLFVTNDFSLAPVTSKAPYSVGNFTPVTIAAASPQVAAVHPSVPARTMKELVAVVKPDQEKYSYSAISGAGLSLLSSVRLFRLGLGLDRLVRVPFAGASPAIASTLAAHTQITFVGLPPVAPHLKEDKLRALAVTSGKRSQAFPGVPTLAESGYPDQESELIIGAVAPAGTPKPVIDLLQKEIARIVVSPDVKERLDVLGFYPVANTPEEYAAQIKSDVEIWGKVVRDANIKVE